MKSTPIHTVAATAILLLSAASGAFSQESGTVPCAAHHYYAHQIPGFLLITAIGETPTPGYQVSIRLSPKDVDPPQYQLVCTPPDGPVPQVVTPFIVTAQFRAPGPLKTVTIEDRNGSHVIPVAQSTAAGEAKAAEQEHVFSGTSGTGDVQAALNAAVQAAYSTLTAGVADGLISWRLLGISGQRGGIAGLNTLEVKIGASAP